MAAWFLSRFRSMRAKILTVLIVLFFIVSIFFIWQCLIFLSTPIIPKDKPSVVYVIAKNMSVKTIAYDLQERGLLNKPLDFILLAYASGDTRNLQAGNYEIESGATPIQLLQQFVQGRVILHAFTIIPGWTFRKVVKKLAQDKYLQHDLIGATNHQIMTAIGHPGEIPEGRFFPDTYKFAAGSSDIDLLKSSYNLMQNKLTQAWDRRATDSRYSCPYKVLIVASIIEKETALASERPIIAGVIQHRLLRKMYLQLDPTLIYGLGDKFKGKLTDADLKQNGEYNTYRRKGLPPTPICLPSESAILAVVHPKETKYLYFVSKGDGSHDFSVTLKEHNLAVKRYIENKGRPYK